MPAIADLLPARWSPLARPGWAQRRWRLPIALPLTPYDQDFRCFVGSQLFGASRAAASVLLSPAPNHLQLQRFLRDRWMPEETYFQTVLGNEASLVLHNGPVLTRGRLSSPTPTTI
jgi:hypothetical protein